MIYSAVNLSDLSVDEICEYLQYKHYHHILSDFEILRKYIYTCNLHEKDNDDTHGILRILIDKLYQDCNLLIKNDTYIFFPKIKNETEVIQKNTLEIFKKIHQNIIENLNKIKKLYNNYQQEKYWNSYTQLSMIEMIQIDETIRNIIYIKEKYIWNKIKNISN